MTHDPAGADTSRLLKTGLALAAWLLALYTLRYGYFEISPEDDPCLRDPASSACAVRATLGTAIHWQVFGLGGLLAAAAGLLMRGAPGRWLSLAGLFFSAAALVLYNSRYGAPAAALSVVALVGEGPRRNG